MDELINFLRERLDDDERIARAVEDRSAPFDGQWLYIGGPEYGGDVELETRNGWSLAVLPGGKYWPKGVLPHIARHDPARVLADVAAKRAIVEYAETRLRSYIGTGAQVAFEWFTLRHLATVYVDHPDYREEWKP